MRTRHRPIDLDLHGRAPVFRSRSTRSGTWTRRCAVACLALASLFAVACSRTETNANPPTPSTIAPKGTPPPTVMDPDARLAQAKSVAVGYFEAQAVNDTHKAQSRSSGAAALAINWAEAVNTLAAANSTAYQVPSIEAPNVRVQLDSLANTDDGRWLANGFVELSFRPGPVASTTSTTTMPPPSSSKAQVAATTTPSTFATDLVFSGDGDSLKLDDYRLDDTPYPVSQLFTDPGASGTAEGLGGEIDLAHRDLDGTVQYIVTIDNGTGQDVTVEHATFAATPTVDGTTAPPIRSYDAQVFADPVPTDSSGRSLVVLPGAFPGSAGRLTVAVASVPPAATTGSATGRATAGTTVAPPVVRELQFDLPDFPTLVTHPTNVIAAEMATTTTSSTSSSTTSSSSTTTAATAPTAPTTPPTSPKMPTTTAGRPTTTMPTSSTTTTTSSSSTTSKP